MKERTEAHRRNGIPSSAPSRKENGYGELAEFRRKCEASAHAFRLAEQGAAGADEALRAAGERLRHAQARFWFDRLREEDRAEGLAALHTAWGADPVLTVRALYAAFRGRSAELAGYLARHADEALPKALPHPIRTVVLYAPVHQKNGVGRVMAMLASRLAEAERDGMPAYRVILAAPGAEEAVFPVSDRVIRREILPFHAGCPDCGPHAAALAGILDSYSVDAFISPDREALWDVLLLRLHPSRPAYFTHVHAFCGGSVYAAQRDPRELTDVIALTDGIIVLCEADRAYLSTVHPNVRFIPNPCFLTGHPRIRRSPGSGNVLWLAVPSRRKRPLDMVRIMERVLREIPGARCRIVGSGSHEQMDALRSEIVKRGLEGSVTLEGFRGNVTPYYEEADVFVSTSSCEAFPLTFYEAAACGLPTVSYDIPWLAYYSDLGGWDTVPQGDVDAAADRIVSILRDSDAWEKRSAALYESFGRYYEHDVTEDWVSLFRDFENGVLPPEQPFDPAVFRMLLRENDRLEAEAARILSEQASALRADAAAAQKALAAVEREQGALSDRLEKEAARHAALTSSVSFRLGRALTFLPRRVRDLMKQHSGASEGTRA